MSNPYADSLLVVTRTTYRSRKGTNNTMTKKTTSDGPGGLSGTAGQTVETYRVSDGRTDPPTITEFDSRAAADRSFVELEKNTPIPEMDPRISAQRNALKADPES